MNKCPRKGGGGPQEGTKRTHTLGPGPGAGGPDSGCWRPPPSLPETQFPNFYKQDWCGLAHVTHIPLTACSLGLLHLPPWRPGSNLGGGVGRGATELGVATSAGTHEPAPAQAQLQKRGRGQFSTVAQWVWETHVPLLPSEAIRNAPLFSG